MAPIRGTYGQIRTNRALARPLASTSWDGCRFSSASLYLSYDDPVFPSLIFVPDPVRLVVTTDVAAYRSAKTNRKYAKADRTALGYAMGPPVLFVSNK